MTRSDKTQGDPAEEDDLLGPKIRHPSGVVCLDVIYMKEKNDKTKFNGAAMLYQDIIKYSLSSLVEDPFKAWQIGNWLLKHNKDYCNYYASGSISKVPQSNKARGIVKRITRYLYNLQKWGLVEQLGLVDSDSKNGLKTPLYRFTTEGYIVARIIKYDDAYQTSQQQLNLKDLEESINRIKKAKHEIYELIKRLFSEFLFFND